jgi:adenine-specific DNA-methyltransferase
MIAGSSDMAEQDKPVDKAENLSTHEVCQRLDISKRTLQNWEKAGTIPPATRDWRGYRIFTEADVESIRGVIDGKAKRNQS